MCCQAGVEVLAECILKYYKIFKAPRGALGLSFSKLIRALLTCTCFLNPGQGCLSALPPAHEDLQGEHGLTADATACACPVDPPMQT